MPILVQVDEDTIEFPDDMSDDEIQSVLQKEYPPTPQSVEPPGLSEADSARISEQLKAQDQFQQNLRAYTGGSPMAIGGPDMDFARALYRDVPAKIGEGIHAVMQPIEQVAAPAMQLARAGTALGVIGGSAIPEIRPGESVVPLLNPAEDAAGIIPSVRRAAVGMTTPAGLTLLPLAGGGGAIARGVQGGFALGAGASIPGGIQSFIEADTAAEQRGAATDVALSALFAGLMGREATRPVSMEIPSSVMEVVSEVPKGAKPLVAKIKPSTKSKTRQTPIERTQNAIQQEAASTVRNVQQAEVAPESARQVPSEVSSPKAAEARISPEVSALETKLAAEQPGTLSNADSTSAGLGAKSVSDLQKLSELNQKYKAEARELMSEAARTRNPELINQASRIQLKTQLTREAIEAATDSGGWKEAEARVPSERLGPRPLDWKQNPEVATWLKENGEKIGIDVSDVQAGATRTVETERPATTPEPQPGITPEQVPALGYLPRQSEALGLGEPSMPPTVESVRAQRAAEARPPQPPPKEPSTTEFPTEGENVKMRKSAERATTSEMIPEPVQETIKTAPESFYRQQSVPKVEDVVRGMSDEQLSTVPQTSNIYVASKLESADRFFKKGMMDEGYNVFVELEKGGTSFGQNINQFKLLKGSRPEHVAFAINKKLEQAGKDPLNKAQEKVAIETAKKSKDADTTLDESTSAWEKNPTPENAAKAEKALLDANEAGLELQRFVSKFQPRSTASIIKSVLQGNLLTPISEVANLVGNTSFLPFRAADRGVATTLDILNNYLRGSKRDITVQPIRGTSEALKGFGRGMKQVPDIFMRGTGDVIKGETRAGLHPIQAWINQFANNPEMPTTKGKLTLQDRVNLAIEGTFGVPAEAMLRGLGAGDVGFKEAAKARATATELSLANVPKSDWSFAQKFPELFLDAKALERIQSDTLQAVFQRPSNTLNVITNWIRGRGELFDLALATVAPYKLTPWNIVGEILSYNPLVAFARSISDYKKGNSRSAKLNAGKYVVGSALTAAGWWLYKNGLMSPSLDQRDESQKARVLAGEVLPPNHINISGLKRALSGGDPAFKPGDETADVFRAGGLAGSMFYMTANIGRDFERSPEVPDSEVWGAILRQSTLEQARFGMNQSFLSGVEGLLSAVREGNADNYIRQWGNTVASIPLPNTLTVMSRASREFKPDFREDTFRKQMENIVRNKLGVAGLDDYLPLKRDLWGEPMRETPEGRNAIMYHFFDVFKNKQVTSDPVPLELFRLWRKTTDTRVIPSLPEKSLTVSGTTYNLTADQQSRYAELVGQSRRQIADAVVVNPNFHKLNDEQKIDLLDRAYRAGLQRGKVQFWRESGGPAGLSTKPQRAGFQQE